MSNKLKEAEKSISELEETIQQLDAEIQRIDEQTDEISRLTETWENERRILYEKRGFLTSAEEIQNIDERITDIERQLDRWEQDQNELLEHRDEIISNKENHVDKLKKLKRIQNPTIMDNMTDLAKGAVKKAAFAPVSIAAQTVKGGVKSAATKANPFDKKINTNDVTDSGVESIRLAYTSVKKTKNAIKTVKSNVKTAQRTIKTTGKAAKATAKIAYKTPVFLVKTAIRTARVTVTIVSNIVAVLLNPVVSSVRIDDENAAAKLAAACSGKTASVTELKKEIKNANPPKLYDLTTLQRDANKQFGYTAQQTLDFLQSLYEKKLSTYPRTDSQYLSDDMEQTAVNMVHTVFSVFPNFGSPQEINVKRCINNAKVTGHHAILPTENIAKSDLSALPEGELHILQLISARLVMATAMPHKYEAVKITVNCENTDFFANGKTVLQDGWKTIEKSVKAALKNANADAEQKEEQPLPGVAQGQVFENVSAQKAEHFTTPPKPYTEDTLLSAMEHAGLENYDEDAEKKGLGTPATRAATIEGLVTHGFAQRKGNQITATEKGVNLIACCPEEVKSPKLTADWEMQLQQIERGKYSADVFMNGIITFVQDICKRYGTSVENSQFTAKSEPLGNCPKCGKPVKNGKYGFYCTGICGMNSTSDGSISISMQSLQYKAR